MMDLQNDGVHALQNDGRRHIVSHLMQHYAMLKKNKHLSQVHPRLPWRNDEGDIVSFFLDVHRATLLCYYCLCNTLCTFTICFSVDMHAPRYARKLPYIVCDFSRLVTKHI
jgi:hypothetical protein